MGTVFRLSTTIDRTIEEWGTGESGTRFHVVAAVNSRNFQYLCVRTRTETVLLEALRTRPTPDDDYGWEWPDQYRFVLRREGEPDQEKIIERGVKGQALLGLEIAGETLSRFNHLTIMQQKGFISLSVRVGRTIQTITPGDRER